jgi:hypothetical protein
MLQQGNKRFSMKVYLGGTSEIRTPVDFDGNEIREGDTLTFDYLDPFFEKDDMSGYVDKPIYKVMMHKSGKGLYAEGIDSELYLHDFRFEYCRKLNTQN